MSTSWNNFKSEMSNIADGWRRHDPTARLFDYLSIAATAIFGVLYVLVNLLHIKETVFNMASLIYPLFLAGYFQWYRLKLDEPDFDAKRSNRELFLLIGIATLLLIFDAMAQ